LALIYISISSKVVSYIYSTAFQAFILGIVALWSMEEPNIFAVSLVFLETILIKGVLLPIFLFRILKKHQSARLIKSLVPDILNIVLITLVIAGSFLLISQEVGSTKSLFESSGRCHFVNCRWINFIGYKRTNFYNGCFIYNY
jgi:hydrogenase-4 membrane subunit HyfE